LLFEKINGRRNIEVGLGGKTLHILLSIHVPYQFIKMKEILPIFFNTTAPR